jgi:hypothetical protein
MQTSSVFLGVATSVVTPPVGTDLAGFIAREAPMTGVHDDLLAKAMVWAEDRSGLNAAALLTLDIIDLSAQAIRSIRSQASALTGMAEDRIGITCTHTHGGPATIDSDWLGRRDYDYLDRLYRTAAETIAAAFRDLESVVMSWGLGRETTVGKNRRILGGIIDPDVPALRFQHPAGKVKALFTSYASHPVTLGPTNLLATADYPGYVRRTLEAVYPGTHVQFATGCCGQINNGHTSTDRAQNTNVYWRTYAEAERIGRAVAGAALQAAEQSARAETAIPVTDVEIVPVEVHAVSRTVPMPLQPLPGEDEVDTLVAGWQAELEEVATREAKPGEIGQLKVFLGWAEKYRAGELITDLSAEVMVLAIGDVRLVLLPGESFVEFGLDIKTHAGGKTITLAYSNGAPGYIPHRSAYPEGGYEVDVAFRYYGNAGCFAPEAGEGLVATAIEFLDGLRQGVTDAIPG